MKNIKKIKKKSHLQNRVMTNILAMDHNRYPENFPLEDYPLP